MNDRRDPLIALSLFAFFSVFYLLTYSGVPHNPDEWFFLRGAQAVVDGDLGAVQSHGWLFSVVVVPFYALSLLSSRIGSYQAASLLNIPVTALTVTILYLSLGEFSFSRRLRLAVALAFGLATLAWPYSHYLFREPLAALLLLVTTWAAIRFWHKPTLASFLAGTVAFALGVSVKLTILAFFPFYLAMMAALVFRDRMPLSLVMRRSSGLTFWLPLAAFVLIVFATAVVASLFPALLAGYLRKWPDVSAFVALWISPGWGLLTFAPILWLAVVGVTPLLRRHPAMAFLVWGGSLFFIMQASAYPIWWGYWAYGPRQLIPLIPVLCLSIPFGLQWLIARGRRIGFGIFWLLAVVGGLVQVVGVMVPFGDYIRQMLFPAGITGESLTWNWHYALPVGMARFWRPAVLDVVWITGRESGSIQVRWTMLLPLVLLTLLALVWLAYVAGAPRHRWPRSSFALSLIVAGAWLPAAILTVRAAYWDERYRPELGFQAAAQMIQRERQPGDIVITDLWTDRLTEPAKSLLNYCHARCPRRLDLVRETLTDRETDWQTRHLDDLVGFRRAWLLLERVQEGDPNSIVEKWLGQVGYLERCDWTGPQVRLCRYSLVRGCPVASLPMAATLGDRIALLQAEILAANPRACPAPSLTPGDVLQVEIAWQALETVGAHYVVSLQLLNAQGQLVASTDRRPANGFRPTTSWQAGDTISDRYAIEIPEAAAPGSYSLVVLMYNPENGRRLPVHLADGARGDMVPLASIQIGAR